MLPAANHDHLPWLAVESQEKFPVLGTEAVGVTKSLPKELADRTIFIVRTTATLNRLQSSESRSWATELPPAIARRRAAIGRLV